MAACWYGRTKLERSSKLMTAKQSIIAELGDREILLPELIARSLNANDQVKYYFALLQTAKANADRPAVPAPDLKSERIAARIDEPALDEIVAGTRKAGPDLYAVPHGSAVLARIPTAIADMLSCLPDEERRPLAERLKSLAPPADAGEVLPGSLISAITSGDRESGDSPHLLVMDAHRAINRLQAETATETLAGARIHHLSVLGRQRVEAFMRGLNRTAPLKFDHPGLGTTATETGSRLIIQNDIGTTDAHVLVVRVEGLTVTLTYTDIHRQRLAFFESLFDGRGMTWEGLEERLSAAMETGQYTLASGRFDAPSEAQLQDFLAFLGSRIVFLIDWNKVRKRLRAFVAKDRIPEVLKWAADHDYGHRGLLEVGGEEALARAVEYAAGPNLRYGQRLDDLIGSERTVAYLKDCLAIASLGLQNRRSRRNINDEIRARLKKDFETDRLAIFDLAASHAAIGYDVAFGVVEAHARLASAPGREWIERQAARAVVLEARADQILNEARDDIKRFARPKRLLEFFEHSDDAIDELEEAAAIVEMAALIEMPREAADRLRDLVELPLSAAQELVKCVECAATVTRSDIRDDLDELISALENLIAIEHRADAILRDTRRWLLVEPTDRRVFVVMRELSQALETATDAQAHAAQALKAYLMEEVIA